VRTRTDAGAMPPASRTQTVAQELLDRTSPLQRAVLHALRGGRALAVEDVVSRIELHTPSRIDAGMAHAVELAVARALDRLASEGAVLRLTGQPARYALAPVLEPAGGMARPTSTPAAATAAAARNAAS